MDLRRVGLDLLGDLWSWVLDLGDLVHIVGVDLGWGLFLSSIDDGEDGENNGDLGREVVRISKSRLSWVKAKVEFPGSEVKSKSDPSRTLSDY